MLPFPFSKARERNARKHPEVKDRCGACGNPLDSGRENYVIYEASRYLTLTAEEAVTFPRQNEYWELSVEQVGPECAKKLKGYLLTREAALAAVEASRLDFGAWRATWPTVERWAIGTSVERRGAAASANYSTRDEAEAAAKEQTAWSSNRKPDAIFPGPQTWYAIGPIKIQVPPSEAGIKHSGK